MSRTRADINLTPLSIPESESHPHIFIPASSASSKYVVQDSPFSSPSLTPMTRLRSISRSSNGSPFPRTPGGTPKLIPMTGNQGFIFSLHQSRANSKYASFIKEMMSRFPTIDLNSNTFMSRFIMSKPGAAYVEYLRQNELCESIEEHVPMPSFATLLERAHLNEQTNINDQIIIAVKKLLSEGVTTINYLGDFNTGYTGADVCHMPQLLRKLKDLNIHFATELDQDSSSNIVFRAFLDGSGGASPSLIFNDRVYKEMPHDEAKKKYSFFNHTVPMTILLISRALPKRPISTTDFISELLPVTPAAIAAKTGATPPPFHPILPSAFPITPKITTPNNLLSPHNSSSSTYTGSCTLPDLAWASPTQFSVPKAPTTSPSKDKDAKLPSLRKPSSFQDIKGLNTLFRSIAQTPDSPVDQTVLAAAIPGFLL